MTEEDFKNIKSISFPNTVADYDKCHYGNSMEKWRFERVMEAGEMAGITWIAVYKNDKKIAHIKQSVCDIFFK